MPEKRKTLGEIITSRAALPMKHATPILSPEEQSMILTAVAMGEGTVSPKVACKRLGIDYACYILTRKSGLAVEFGEMIENIMAQFAEDRQAQLGVELNKIMSSYGEAETMPLDVLERVQKVHKALDPGRWDKRTVRLEDTRAGSHSELAGGGSKEGDWRAKALEEGSETSRRVANFNPSAAFEIQDAPEEPRRRAQPDDEDGSVDSNDAYD